MINPQLLDYIRQQLAGGVSKEDAAKSLVANGWQASDINEAFSSLEKTPPTPVVPEPMSPASTPIVQTGIGTENTIWTKGIPRTNKGFMIVSLLLVFGLDLVILFGSGMSLLAFWIEMLVVLAIFGLFFYLENYVFKKRFANSHSNLDTWISLLAVIRNLIFVLNFIPLIQILGGMALVYGGIPYLIIYILLLTSRSKAVHAS